MESDDAIVYRAGKLIPSEQLLRSAQFKNMIPLVENSKNKLRDVCSYLFFMRSPRSIFMGLPDDDKFKQIKSSGRLIDPEWLTTILDHEDFRELYEHYAALSLTPSERMRVNLIQSIQRFLSEVAAVPTDNSDEMVKKVAQSDKLFDAVDKLEKMILKESKQKVKNGYKVRLFESRPESGPTLAAQTNQS